MGLFDHFPYTNVHELNLDWIVSMMKALEAEWDAFTAGNSLTFADPMLHDVTKTYAKNTIVLDGNGNAYVSLQAVPVGVGLQNGDYWLMVFDYEAFIEKVNKNFTANYYRGSYRAASAMAIGDWLTVDDVLYKATAAIAIDDVLEDGVNITHFTLEDFIKAFMQSANQMIQQYKNDIDASELLYRQQLAQDIANTTNSLQAQLDAALSGVTVDSEVINARVGADGVTYGTLGDAIRTQIGRLNDIGIYFLPISSSNVHDGFVYGADGVFATSTSWHRTDKIVLPFINKNYKMVIRTSLSSGGGFAFYDKYGSYIIGFSGVNLPPDGSIGLNFITVEIPEDAYSIALSLENADYVDESSFIIGYSRTGFEPDLADIMLNIAFYNDIFNNAALYDVNDVTLTINAVSGYYGPTGSFSTYADIYAAEVSVLPGERYFLTSNNFYNMSRAVFFDSNDNFIYGYPRTYDEAANVDTEIVVPLNAVKMILQKHLTTTPLALKKIVGFTANAVTSILSGKNITVIGDSITAYNWRAAKNWSMYINEWAGAIFQNLGSSGTGFAAVDPYINRISQIQATPDVIGVAMSWNDMSAGLPNGDPTDTGTTSLAGYANDFFDALITAYPTTPIICYCQGPWQTMHPGTATTDDWMDVLSEICKLKGIPFYKDLYYGSVLRPWIHDNRVVYFTSDNPDLPPTGVEDGAHPNGEGHKVIARYLYPKFTEALVTTGLNYK